MLGLGYGLLLCCWVGFQPALAQKEVRLYPLSRQDSVLIDKYTQLSKEWQERGDKKEASRYQNDIALIYWNHNDYRSAIVHYENSLELNRYLDNKNGIAAIHNNLGMLHSDLGNFEQAYEYFQRTLSARRANKEKIGMISALINLSVVLNNLQRYQESVTQLEEALDIARSLNDPDQMKSCYGMLSETHEKAGNSEKSIYYFELYRTFHEKVQDDRIAQTQAEAEAARLRAQLAEAEKRNKELEIQRKDQRIASYDSTQKSLLASLNRQELEVMYFKQQERIKKLEAIEAKERQRLLDAQLAQAELVRNAFIGGFLLILVFSFFLYRNYQQKKRINTQLKEQNHKVSLQNEEISSQRDKIMAQSQALQTAFEDIEDKNLQITQSINYAQRIQAAMLTRSYTLQDLIPESFILFRPRDIVSGDFYWYAQKNGKILIAAVDCTGHGVPGAFMSMIGNNILDTIVKTQGITAPDLILSALHQGVVESLHQDKTENKDGMDMALVSIDLPQQTLHFAGANRPLVYAQNNELQVIKGNRYAIGGYRKGKTSQLDFDAHTISFRDAPLAFYIFSDGYPDQFGGKSDRKFMTKRLKACCFDWHTLPAQTQFERFDQTLRDWMGQTPQIDDILLIGGKVGQQHIPEPTPAAVP